MKNNANNGKNESNAAASAANHTSPVPHSPHPIIPPRGDYQTLLSYRKAEVVYDITWRVISWSKEAYVSA